MPHSRSISCLPAILFLAGSLLSLPAAQGAETPLRQLIDTEVQAGWKKEKLTPARKSSDAEFLRRIHLDLVGVIPSWEETLTFLDSKDADKRQKLIDRLLADPRFSRHQADIWDLILFGRHPPGFDTDKREGFHAWLRKQFADNVPYNTWVRDLLRAEGNSVENATLYYVQYRSAPEDASEAISQTFLGVQLQCARCHDHPYESWTQRDFYGMAAFLARLDVVTVGRKNNLNLYAIGERNSGDVLFTGPAKEQQPGKKGEPVKPKFLQGKPLEEPALPPGFKEERFAANKMPPKPKFSRKDQLADWITSVDNPYFARAITNRVWGQYLGRGIVHPIDNLSAVNKPSHPELLDRMTKALIEHKFDLKWYIRELVSSETYQLSCAGTGEPFPRWFQHARMRPLSAEELIESWQVATGYLAAEKAAGKTASPDRFRPLGSGYLLRFFGSPNTGTGNFQGGLHEHLYLNNGPLSQMIGGGKGTLAEFVTDKKQPMEIRIERLFLATLNRRPSADEQKKFTEFLTGEKASPGDAVWALITCSEFRFNH